MELRVPTGKKIRKLSTLWDVLNVENNIVYTGKYSYIKKFKIASLYKKTKCGIQD